MYSLQKNSVAAFALFAFVLFGFAISASAQSSSDNYQNNDTKWLASANLRGSNEVPSVSTTTTSGSSTVRFDENGANMTARVDVFDGDQITAAHLHCGDVGENGPVVVGLFANSSGVNVDGQLASVSIDNGDISSEDCTDEIGYNIDDVDDLSQAIRNGDIYVNVHDEDHPNGVIRGQLSAEQSDNNGDGNDNDGYSNGHDRDDSNRDWDNSGHRTDGYWNNDNSWHSGMDGKSDYGYWGTDGCWRETSDDGKGGHNDWDDNQSDWNDDDSDWMNENHSYEYDKADSQNDDSHDWENDGKGGHNDWEDKDWNNRSSDEWDDSDRNDSWSRDGKDGEDGRDGYDGNDGDDGKDGRDGNSTDRYGSRSWRGSSSSSSVSSVINAVNSVRVSVR